MGLSIWELIIVLGILLLVFGPSRIEGIGKSLGRAIRGFKDGVKEGESDSSTTPSEKKKEL